MANSGHYLEESFIEQVKEAVDIVDIISKYVELKKTGDNYKGLCPFHGEKTPSFVVNDKKQMFKCFGCGEGGNVISFLMKRENVGFIEAVKMLCEHAHIDFPQEGKDNNPHQSFLQKQKKRMYQLHIEIAQYYFENMQNNENESMEYLKQRGIEKKTIRKFGLGYEGSNGGIVEYLLDKGYSTEELLLSKIFRKKEDGDKVYSIFFRRIMFPIFDYKGRVIAFGGRVVEKGEPKYLNSPESKRQDLYDNERKRC